MTTRVALIPCPACRRHVRSGASACPFCATAIESQRAPPVAVSTRLGSIAKVTFRAAVAGAAIAACGGESTTDDGQKTSGPASAGTGGEMATGGTTSTGGAEASGGTAGALNDDPPPATGGGGTIEPSPDPDPDPTWDAGGPVPIYRATPSE